MKIAVAMFAILIALALLNPEMGEFREHVEGAVGERLASETGAGTLQRMGAGAVALLAEQVTVRKNYLLFSTYTIDLDGPDHEGNDWQFLGIGGMFVQLREPGSQSSGGSDAGS